MTKADLPERLRPADLFATIRAMEDEYMADELCDYTVINGLIEVAIEQAPEAASLIQRLEGERDEWKADAKHYISRCGEQQEALETAEQALSASQKEVERLTSHLSWAVTELEEWDAYQTRPERVDYGVECACCMGEMFDAESRARLQEARSALQTGGKEHG